jgi:hypothetical protein
MLEALERREFLSADGAGNTLAAARVIAVSSTAAIFSDWVGRTDVNDYYRLTLSAQSNFALTLTGLSADADVQLLDSSGRVLSKSDKPGAASESISATLATGTYYIRVYRYSGDTNYALGVSASATAADGAGNTPGTACNLGVLTSSTITKTDWVGSTDLNDYYKFTLTSASDVSVGLTGLSADADLALLDASGRSIGSSTNSNATSEAIATSLKAGTYYVRVYRYAGNTNYTLTLAASVNPVDNAGNTLATANDLGTLSSTAVSSTDWVGTTDANDYYKFTLSGQSTLSLGLAGMSANADVELLDASGNTLASGTNSGSSDEALSATMDAGTYYVRVYSNSGSTNYTLSLLATAVAPVPDNPTDPVTISSRDLVSLTQLDIVGTSGNDSIVVTQSGTTLSITANGTTTTRDVSGCQELAIWGGDGGDTITVDSSVTLATLIYGGAGHDTITDGASGRATIVAIGGGSDTLTGNGSNTSFWFDSTDTANVTAADRAAGRVHSVTAFYQPFTSNSASSQYVSLELNGQNLTDPTDSGTTTRLTNRSLWGTGATVSDVNQGNLGDCYYLATLAGLANSSAATLQELAVDLGDGTYAVQFTSNGTTSYVRVDGDLAATSSGSLEYNSTGASGDLWACIMEKAYVFFASRANTYAGIEGGLMSQAFSALGIANTTSNPATTSTTALYNSISAALAAGHAVTVGTFSTVAAGIPLVGGHAYTVISASSDTAGNITYVLRNPWGVDGATNSSDPNDGLITVTAAQLRSACDLATWAV